MKEDIKSALETILLCLECEKELTKTDSDPLGLMLGMGQASQNIYCSNIDCTRYGLVTVIGLISDKVKELRKTIKKKKEGSREK